MAHATIKVLELSRRHWAVLALACVGQLYLGCSSSDSGAAPNGPSAGGSDAAGGSDSSGGADSAGGGSSGGASSAGSGGDMGAAGAPPIEPPPALTDSVMLHIAGDSTAAPFPATDGRVGWASVW